MSGAGCLFFSEWEAKFLRMTDLTRSKFTWRAREGWYCLKWNFSFTKKYFLDDLIDWRRKTKMFYKIFLLALWVCNCCDELYSCRRWCPFVSFQKFGSQTSNVVVYLATGQVCRSSVKICSVSLIPPVQPHHELFSICLLPLHVPPHLRYSPRKLCTALDGFFSIMFFS